MNPTEVKELKEMEDFINAYMKLEAQKRNPSREGMIEALKDALKVASTDIKSVEESYGETTPTPWENIPNEVLYSKLFEYQQGMYQHAIKKFGEEVVKKLFEKSMQ